MKYKSNNNIVYSCKYHVVFCPKSLIVLKPFVLKGFHGVYFKFVAILSPLLFI